MTKTTRREAIRHLACGSAGAMLLRHRSLWQPRPPTDPLALAARLVRAGPDRMRDVAHDALRGGATWQTLQGALFLAAIGEVNPIPVGGILHAALAASPSFALANAGPPHEALLPVLHNLAEVRDSVRIDAARGDWRLPPAPEGRGVTASGDALARSLRERDGAAADRALMPLLRERAAPDVFEPFWMAGARCFAGLAHKMLLVAHVHRTLSAIGWQYAERPLRALCHAMSDTYRIDEYPDDGDVRRRAAALPAGPDRIAAPSPEHSHQLFLQLRTATPGEAVERVVAAQHDGAAPNTIWDALFLVASDVFAREPALLTVHPVTVVNAMAYAHRTAASAPTRNFVLLQAAAWMASFRQDFAGRASLAMDGPGLPELPASDGATHDSTVDAAFASPTRERVAACVADPQRRGPFEARLRSTLYRGATEVHQIKLAAAALENARRSHARLAPLILCPLLEYLPTDADPETERHAASVEFLRPLRQRR